MDTYNQFLQNYGMTKPDAYNPYAAGYKMYGGGRSNPTNGPVDKAGYMERERNNRARRSAALQAMQAAQRGDYNNPFYLRGH